MEGNDSKLYLSIIYDGCPIFSDECRMMHHLASHDEPGSTGPKVCRENTYQNNMRSKVFEETAANS